MGSSMGQLAVELLKRVEISLARSTEERSRQLGELENMVAELEQGSSSLNQRATTLSTLAVAALGTFGVFAAQLDSITMRGLAIATAVLLGAASFALLFAAWFALRSVRPAGKWSDNFAVRAEAVAKGEMGDRRRLEHLVRTVQSQLERNNTKARSMKLANDCAAGAVVAATAAVIPVLVDIVLR